jgi:hypothetical protein
LSLKLPTSQPRKLLKSRRFQAGARERKTPDSIQNQLAAKKAEAEDFAAKVTKAILGKCRRALKKAVQTVNDTEANKFGTLATGSQDI